ncbi:MAG: ATP-dependent DNA helicase RecG [Blautia sp.]|jgi:ATP-dependent DNA helicase RecG
MEKKSLQTLKGIGEKTEKLFLKLNIKDTKDLLYYYPRDYDVYEPCVSIEELKEGHKAAVLGKITAALSIAPGKRASIATTTITGESGRKLSLMWYHMPFLRNVIKKGMLLVFRGTVRKKNGKLLMEHPEYYTPGAYEEKLHHLQPIYGLTAGLTGKTIAKAVAQVLEERALSGDPLPEEIREKYQLADYNFAIQTIHFPENMEQLLIARKRLVFDEFLLFILSIQQLKEKNETASNAYPMRKVWATEEVIENLPYQLTKAQQQVWREMEQDLTGHKLMSRLVQGDVGSGKTVLAFLGMILTVENGYQAALMVPTEVLAKQHFEAFCKMQEENGLENCHPVLLTGSLTAKEKRERYARIKDGSANIIIGTHALIQEKVVYKDLALVITDEQHRFGVKQREALAEGGNKPHVLVMSATPIPRTLAIILYGDLDISVIDELPARRLPIKNCVVDTSYRPKAYRFMEQQVKAGRQVYVICPMVEESEGLEAENVLDYTKKLQRLFPREVRIAALHGRMKPKEKNQIMEAFARGEIHILVSTTVVEVGVNVPNATVMMIENAERFGLAQLHQLRGRVGRGEHQSYCIFMQGNSDEETSRRLKILNESNDGFHIAGEDLKLRGPGDLFGIRQSGDLEFKLADIFQDAAVLKSASEAAGEILALDFDLTMPQHEALKKKLEETVRENIDHLGL